MEHNPYTPPATQELETQEITFMQEIVPRPVAVWILLAILVIFTAFLAWGTAKLLWAVLSYRDEIRNIAGAALTAALRLLVIAVLVFLSVCIHRGAHWSRWLGVAAILGFSAIGLLSPDNTHYANEAERTGGFFGRMIILPLLMAWWAYAFGFSSKARHYFSRRPSK
jgi:hypothetical protein